MGSKELVTRLTVDEGAPLKNFSTEPQEGLPSTTHEIHFTRDSWYRDAYGFTLALVSRSGH